MGTLSIRIPDSYHQMVKEAAKTDNISINQFISSAIGEKLTAMQTENYLQKRGALGSRNRFLEVLHKAPNTPVQED